MQDSNGVSLTHVHMIRYVPLPVLFDCIYFCIAIGAQYSLAAMLLVCVVPVVVCGTLPLLALLIIRHMYTTSVVMVMVTATSTRSTVMYTPCSVAGRVSIATGPVVEEQLHVASTADNSNVVVVVVVVVVIIIDVVVVVDVSVDVVDLLFTVYPELGWRALLVMVDGVADWHIVLVG